MSSDPARSGPVSLFLTFLKLGCTSFGGPVAHIGIFRSEFVERRAWLSDRDYADMVALAQFLPGPASSQVGMGLGLMRGGLPGMAAAWLGFTLPSALLMLAFALGLDRFGLLEGAAWIAGIKAAVAAVVAQALIGMARSLTPDAPRVTLAGATMAAVLLLPIGWAQPAAIAVAALIGLALPGRFGGPDRDGEAAPGLSVPVARPIAWISLGLFFALLIGLPLAAIMLPGGTTALFDAFYRAGALVFGGGHVVLPLLQGELVEPGLLDRDAFLAGYGGAQVVPGLMVTIATHLGTLADVGPAGIVGGLIATVAIFLPGALLMLGALPFWATLSANRTARPVLAAVGAGVVGLLAAALYDPVVRQGIPDAPALILAVTAYIALAHWKAPVWAVIPAAGLIGAVAL
jgi:chromate transporter